MLANAFLLLMSSAFLTLRLGGRNGSFPRPLSAQEEREYVARWCAGDMQARNLLLNTTCAWWRISSRNTIPPTATRTT